MAYERFADKCITVTITSRKKPFFQRVRKARERLEARRATDRTQVAEKILRARQAGREAKFNEECTERERKAVQIERRENLLRAHLLKKEVSERSSYVS